MDIQFSDITFEGPAISNHDLLNSLPQNLKSMLQQKNGFIAFGGGFHLRGICSEPSWHSLELFWTGKYALSKLFPSIQEKDIPFGQDCMGDQYVLRNNEVIKLQSESGNITNLKMDFLTFIEEAQENPFAFLQLAPLKQLQNEGKKLEPGQLVNEYPPFITAESKNGVSLAPIPTIERILFLADFSKQISKLPDGTIMKIVIRHRKKWWWPF